MYFYFYFKMFQLPLFFKAQGTLKRNIPLQGRKLFSFEIELFYPSFGLKEIRESFKLSLSLGKIVLIQFVSKLLYGVLYPNFLQLILFRIFVLTGMHSFFLFNLFILYLYFLLFLRYFFVFFQHQSLFNSSKKKLRFLDSLDFSKLPSIVDLSLEAEDKGHMAEQSHQLHKKLRNIIRRRLMKDRKHQKMHIATLNSFTLVIQ